MRKTGIYLILFAVVGLFAACSPIPFKVISYNVRVNSASDGPNRWDCRKQASINMIREERPTVFGVQEAQPVHMEYLKANLPEYGCYGVGREDGVASGEHMAIFYRTDQVELLDCGTFWLSQTPDTPSRGWDAMCKRTCTWAKLKMKRSGKVFVYLNTHLDHVGVEARVRGMELIVSRIKELAPEGEPVFLTADFNMVATHEAFDVVRDLLDDARQVAPQSDHRATLNCWDSTQVNRADWVIDHIFVRGVNVENFEVLRDKNYGAPFISDHYPVIMRGAMRR